MKWQVSRIHFRNRPSLPSPDPAPPDDASTPIRLVSQSIASNGTDPPRTGSIVVRSHLNDLAEALEGAGDDPFSSRRRRELEAWGDLHPSKLPSWKRAKKRARKEVAGWRVPAPPPPRGTGEVRLDHQPRRPAIEVEPTKMVSPPMIKLVTFSATWLQVLVRMQFWIYGGLLFSGGELLDRLLRRRSIERTAVRLRVVMERLGGTFVKFGQQMSMRVDLLPMAVCTELSKMLDQLKPFPTAQAITIIERAIGRPLSEVFEQFDPVPIGSASIACVFQGTLKDGRKVAVKVRRPNIGKQFAADLRAMNWVLHLMEYFTIIRSGLTANLHHELNSMLMEELNFKQEARYTDLFRRRARKQQFKFIKAPRICFDLSNEEVIVSEFVTGVWLGEVMSALEASDEGPRRRLEELGIKPKKIARRLCWAAMFGMHDSLVFHADPHPGNIVIQPGNKLMFIDFGSCGGYVERDRQILRDIQTAHSRGDLSAMVQAFLALIEPLPPIDVTSLQKKMEQGVWLAICALKAKHGEWWERTSAGLWLVLLQLTSEFQLPMNLNTLRTVRSTLLYDTIAARLDPRIDVFKFYRTFARFVERREVKRAKERMCKRLKSRPQGSAYLTLERVGDMGTQVMGKVQRALNMGSHSFAFLMSKASYAGVMIIRTVSSVLTIALAGGIYLYTKYYLDHKTVDEHALLTRLVSNPAFVIVIVLIIILNVRKILTRFKDPNIE